MARNTCVTHAHRLLHANVTEPGRPATSGSWSGQLGGFRLAWWSIALLVAVGATPSGLAVLQGTWRDGLPVTTSPMQWTEGLIQAIGASPEGSSVMSVDAGGQEVTLGVDFNATSVYQTSGVLSAAHLHPGQGIRARHTIPTQGVGRAKTVEITHESRHGTTRRGIPSPSGG